jgi:hypothetical protein
MGRWTVGRRRGEKHHEARAMIAFLNENRQCLSAKTEAADDDIARRRVFEDGIDVSQQSTPQSDISTPVRQKL